MQLLPLNANGVCYSGPIDYYYLDAIKTKIEKQKARNQ